MCAKLGVFMKRGFSLVELLIVISIIGILASVVISTMSSARSKAQFARAQAEFKSIANALELYWDDHGEYPEDVTRDVSPGLGEYLASDGDNDGWPDAPWPGSVYDWDNWDDPDSAQNILQISIRFCPTEGELEDCRFPTNEWAEDFGWDSAVYYCVSGACRAHNSQPITYPGYCVNCDVQPSDVEEE